MNYSRPDSGHVWVWRDSHTLNFSSRESPQHSQLLMPRTDNLPFASPNIPTCRCIKLRPSTFSSLPPSLLPSDSSLSLSLQPSMKFGKILRILIENMLPGWRDKFLSYKELKQHLKLIFSEGVDDPSSNRRPRLATDVTEGGEAMTSEEKDFIDLLEAEIDKFNLFFLEREEDYIIRQKELQNRAAKAKDSIDELMGIWKEIVDFHGEMVLLENYSALNYTGLVKILKKYEKKTGALIRLPFIQKILQQPFYTTDLLNKLIKECETMLDCLFPYNGPSISVSHVEEHQPKPEAEKNGLLKCPTELAEIENMESFYLKSTLSALEGLKEIRSGSSTVSVFSLPPLQSSGLEGSRVKILEQVAKDVVV